MSEMWKCPHCEFSHKMKHMVHKHMKEHHAHGHHGGSPWSFIHGY